MSSHRDQKVQKTQEKNQFVDNENSQKKIKLSDEQYSGIRLGGLMARTKNWWDEAGDTDDEDSQPADENAAADNNEWKYLEHHGVLFPAFYKRHNVPLLYEGRTLALTEEQEELCTFWAQTIGTVWDEKATYRKNFTEMMRGKLGLADFALEKCDFSVIRTHLDQQRQVRLARSEEVKKQEKADKEHRDKFYGYALVDGCLERVGSYTLEPPTLFKGRGEHPKAGLLKARQQPEDLTVNVSSQAAVPRCSLAGHSWGNIVSRNDVTWLISYVDSSIRKDNHKYVQFAATSRFKQMNDKKKYEKARRLKNCIEVVRLDYMKKLNSDAVKERQLGTATYLIDRLALRVGNEKDEDEADTVGCCSLRCEHIQVKDDDKVVFDFLGKDSMRYYNEVSLDSLVCRNLRIFQKGKAQDKLLFDAISTDELNDYLKTQMKGLTAKVFRTYNASHTLQQELDRGKAQLQDYEDLQRKVDYYDTANKQVAILCNHQKTIPKSFEITKQKIQYKIDIYKHYVEELEEHHKARKMDEYEEEVDLEAPGDVQSAVVDKKSKKKQTFIKKFPGTKEKTRQQIDKMKAKIDKEEATMMKKEENKEIALGTSKTNYNDPRISVAWCKLNDVPIERIFPKTLRGKFIWSMATDPAWKF